MLSLTHTHTFTHKGFHTQRLLHTYIFTHRRFDTQTLWHTDTFTHRHFYTQRLLHTEAFTHRRFYTQAHKEADTYTHTQTGTDTHAHKEADTYTQTRADTHRHTHTAKSSLSWPPQQSLYGLTCVHSLYQQHRSQRDTAEMDSCHVQRCGRRRRVELPPEWFNQQKNVWEVSPDKATNTRINVRDASICAATH